MSTSPEKRPSTHPDPQVRAVVDSLPPLTDRQRANLAVLFAPYVKKPDSLTTPRARARRRTA